MIPIKTYKIEDVYLKHHLERIGDLINIEGPMLSLYMDNRNNNLYLFDWADSDENINRWIVYKIDTVTLKQFIEREISFKEMFESPKIHYVTNIKNGKTQPFEISKIEKLPSEYYPVDNSLFDESDARNLPQIKSLIEKLINKSTWQNKMPNDELSIPNFRILNLGSIFTIPQVDIDFDTLFILLK